jgi:hypothetical protein
MANQITTFLDPAQLPNRSQDQQTFDGFMALLMQNLPKWGAEINTVLANLNAIAAGGAYAITYTFDSTSTADTDPGAGKLRLNNYAAQNAATVIRVDNLDPNGTDWGVLFDSIQTVTSAIKGSIKLTKQGDPSKWLIFDITGGISNPGGYRNITGTVRQASAVSPFTNADALTMQIQRTGDKGDTGPVYTPPVLHLREEKASGTNGAVPTFIAANLFRRPLNTVKTNTMTGASLASDQFVLPAGTHELDAAGFSVVNTGTSNATYYHKMALYNVTDGAYTLIGKNAVSRDHDNTADYQSTEASVRGQFTIAAAKTFELRHLTPSANLATPPAASTGQVEVYTDVFIKKVA